MKLSIITINYNNCEGLRKTIDSVVAQTWQEFEWIIVDGGSTDGSRELIEETAARLQSEGWPVEHFSLLGFTAEDWKAYPSSPEGKENVDSVSNVKVLKWCSEPDKGIYNAMNKGIVKALGEYCLFLNSGDWLYKEDVLEKVMESFVLNADFECFDMIEEGSERVKYVNKLSQPTVTGYQLVYGALPHQATFIRRCLFETIGLYDEEMKISSDWKHELYSIICNGATTSYRPFIFACIQPDGISKVDKKLRQEERISVLKDVFPELVLKDYQMLHSFVEVYESSPVCRRLYAFVYRLADWINKRKNR